MSQSHTESAALVDKLMNDLERQMHERSDPPTALDRAMADAWIRGRGYIRFTDAGAVEHIPYDEVHRTDEQQVTGEKR